MHSDDLIAARAVAGDDKARRALVRRIAPVADADGAFASTARTYLTAGSLEGTARALFVHANTVRYRLARIHDLTGLDLTAPDDAFVARLALMVHDLDAARSTRRGR